MLAAGLISYDNVHLFQVLSVSLSKQRLAQFKPIREVYLHQGMRKRISETVAKTIVSATEFMKF